MEIRRARLDDASEVARLGAQLGYPTERAEMSSRVAAVIADGQQELLIAEGNGAVLGWLHVRRATGITDVPRAEITSMVVDETARGGGIGARLVEAAEQWAREQGLFAMIVRSQEKRERAHAFYRRLGYGLKKTSLVFVRALR